MDNTQDKPFVLKKTKVGYQDVAVFRLPALPKRFAEALEWKEGYSLRMKLTENSVIIERIRQTNGESDD